MGLLIRGYAILLRPHPMSVTLNSVSVNVCTPMTRHSLIGLNVCCIVVKKVIFVCATESLRCYLDTSSDIDMTCPQPNPKNSVCLPL